MVIRNVRQRGRLNKTVTLARTERSSLSKSHFFKTSMKKLAPLARQIAGKPIDEAILQMRFSKKKVAKEVRGHLLQAKNEAIVARGMGLGHLEQDINHAQPPPPPTNTTTSFSSSSTATIITTPEIPPNPDRKPKYLPGTTIPSNLAHRPATDIYISQAWINRGPYGRAPDYRAMGRVNIMRPPNTGLSVLLKEEKTRAREAAEREMKRIRHRMGKNMWTQLPDRKITRQGQYLLW
jgi:ribosomal protein L22